MQRFFDLSANWHLNLFSCSGCFGCDDGFDCGGLFEGGYWLDCGFSVEVVVFLVALWLLVFLAVVVGFSDVVVGFFGFCLNTCNHDLLFV